METHYISFLNLVDLNYWCEVKFCSNEYLNIKYVSIPTFYHSLFIPFSPIPSMSSTLEMGRSWVNKLKRTNHYGEQIE